MSSYLYIVKYEFPLVIQAFLGIDKPSGWVTYSMFFTYYNSNIDGHCSETVLNVSGREGEVAACVFIQLDGWALKFSRRRYDPTVWEFLQWSWASVKPPQEKPPLMLSQSHFKVPTGTDRSTALCVTMPHAKQLAWEQLCVRTTLGEEGSLATLIQTHIITQPCATDEM